MNTTDIKVMHEYVYVKISANRRDRIIFSFHTICIKTCYQNKSVDKYFDDDDPIILMSVKKFSKALSRLLIRPNFRLLTISMRKLHQTVFFVCRIAVSLDAVLNRVRKGLASIDIGT